MMNTSTFKRFVYASAAAAALMLAGGALSTVHGQRDPFQKPGYMKPRPTTGPGSAVAKPKVEVNYGPPAIEARIEYFKHMREMAAANGQPLPKVTSVLTLGEMAVTGIFKTPRGYAAMVEATPIKLSYTIYPGEKFFDGQLVAVEENRLVFRKVTKMSNGKFNSSVENMALRKYTEREQIQGTAPVDSETANNKGTPKLPELGPDGQPVKPLAIVSPLEEMNKQVPKDDAKAKSSAKPTSKPVRVAKKGK